MPKRGHKKREIRYMWMMVMFDLPVADKKARRHATRFRNFLKDDGYTMIQFSVYTRPVRGEDSVQKHLDRVIKALPPEGSVRALSITERQYARMRLLIGERTKTEKIGSKQLVLL